MATNLSISGKLTVGGGVNLTSLTASRALVTDASKNIVSSSITNTELGYLDGVTSAIQTQLNNKAASSHTHSAATTSTAGLMSASDKSKLDSIAKGANKYTLPTASSSTLGGVKTTSTVTSTSGLTACPIISGVPYYKDTNTKYSLSSFGITATAAELNKLDGCTATVTELNYVDGVTSNIQTQLNGKAASSHNHSASNITSGTLPITRGGTGATSASAARTALGAAASSHTHAKNQAILSISGLEGSTASPLYFSYALNATYSWDLTNWSGTDPTLNSSDGVVFPSDKIIHVQFLIMSGIDEYTGVTLDGVISKTQGNQLYTENSNVVLCKSIAAIVPYSGSGSKPLSMIKIIFTEL